MKGLNVRKIAAFAGAAVLAFGAIAAADVVYGSTQLVDQNGQPTVKIYVGSKAMVSDGVAAANIAAKIANEAYKSSTLTASVSGTPSCTVGAGVSGTGTCPIVESSKKVTLEVTVPGTVAGTHTFKTLITDTIDKTLANRNSTRDEDMYVALLSSSDTSGTITSPLRTYSVNGTVAKNLYRIGSGQFTGFADYSVVDTQATSATYNELQSFWIGSGNDAVKYDTDSSIRDVAVNTYSAMVYSAKFEGNDFGIPVCTGDLSSNYTDDWTSCDADGNSMTERHRVKIKFMGSEWVISEMKDPGVSNPSQTAIINGGQIKLAKEAKYGIINVGQTLDAGTFKIRLSDISVAVGATNKHPAIIDVLDANDAVVGQIQVDPGTTYTYTQGGTGSSVKIHVYKTAPGFTLNAKWAEIAIFSDEITLKDTKNYNLVSNTDTDHNYKVALLWKNRDFPGGTTGSSQNNKTDSLREIVIYDVDTFTGNKYKAGDVYNFLKSVPTYKLTYNGVDLTDDDYQPVSFNALSKISGLRVANSAGGDTACSDTSASDMSYTAKFIQVKANSNLFGGSGLLGSYMIDKFYIDPIGWVTPTAALNMTAVTSNATTTLTTGYAFTTALGSFTYTATNITNASATADILSATTFRVNDTAGANNIGWLTIPTSALVNGDAPNGTQTYGSAFATTSPKIFFQPSGKSCWNWVTITPQAATGVTDVSQAIKFETAGDNSAAYGAIYLNASRSQLTGFDGMVILQEDAGKVDIASNYRVMLAVPYNLTATMTSDDPFRFKSSDSATAKIWYDGVRDSALTDKELTFVTERGSKAVSLGTTDATVKVAKRVGMPTFQFAMSDTSTTTGGEEYVMGVGESKVFGGVTLKVKAIDGTTGSCSVLGPGGKPACEVDSASLMAVLQPNNAATVTVSEPFALKSSMVMMDSDGASSGVAVLVGGPMVNTMTADALKDTTVNLQTDGPVVKEIGNKIVVAGYTAADTMAAADAFIAGVKRQ